MMRRVRTAAAGALLLAALLAGAAGTATAAPAAHAAPASVCTHAPCYTGG